MWQRSGSVRAGQTVPTEVVLVGQEGGFASIPSVSVELDESQTPLSTGFFQAWLITVKAEIVVGRQAVIGQVVTYPPSSGVERSRCILQASCPGAKRWTVGIVRADQPDLALPTVDADREAVLTVAACPDLLVPGIAVMPMSGVIVGERVGFWQGALAAGAQIVTLNPPLTTVSRRLVKLSIFQDGTGGTVDFHSVWLPGGLAPAVPLPPNGSAMWDFGAGIWMPFRFDTAAMPAGGGGYIAEYRW